MTVEARGELTFILAMLVESLLEELVGQDSCCMNSIHTHIDFEINILVVENVTQVVFFNDLIR